jgi:S-adenosylmethionine:tRNA ribosyltransferase-isomerase
MDIPVQYRLSTYDYDLPEGLIAHTPLPIRSDSRLMVCRKGEGKPLSIDLFSNLASFIPENSLLVMNKTKVISARILAVSNYGGEFEFFLLKKTSENRWESLSKPAKRAKIGKKFKITPYKPADKEVYLTIIEEKPDGHRIIEFSEDIDYKVLEQIGYPPIPHYIHNEEIDINRYQTVFADEYGSVAAPTASLHFDDDVFNRLRNKNIDMAYVNLHVGLGTFKPIQASDIREHRMHSETWSIEKSELSKIQNAKKSGKNIIAVGTTAMRTLESAADSILSGESHADISGETDIFIYPGYEFKIADELITNFHLPKSSLIVLVSAFGGIDAVRSWYQTAIEGKMRFYSFGDAMYIQK